MLAQSLAQIPIQKTPPKKYTCVNCSVEFGSTAEQRSHFKTEWHLYNLKRKVCKLEPIDFDSFQKIHEAAPKPVTDDSETREARARAKSDQQSRQTKQDQGRNEEFDSDDEANWEIVDDEELVDEDYDNQEIEEMLSRVVKSNTCLFCDKTNTTIQTNLNHMSQMHGFFIPEDQYLIDLEGLLEYLGFKVGAGMTCLWCNKQFSSLHGVRLHMLYKDHCKILYDHQKAIDEFKDFYDYSSQEQIEMKPMSELALVSGKTSRLRRQPYNECSLIPSRPGLSKQQQLVVRPKVGAIAEANHQQRSFKRFNAVRAKLLLRTGMMNNQTMRSRIRLQNPM